MKAQTPLCGLKPTHPPPPWYAINSETCTGVHALAILHARQTFQQAERVAFGVRFGSTLRHSQGVLNCHSFHLPLMNGITP